MFDNNTQRSSCVLHYVNKPTALSSAREKTEVVLNGLYRTYQAFAVCVSSSGETFYRQHHEFRVNTSAPAQGPPGQRLGNGTEAYSLPSFTLQRAR